jgi:hypothetical protein
VLGSARVESAVVRPPGPRGTEARSPSLLVAGALLRRLLAKKTLLAPSGGHRAARATTRGHCGARSPRTLRARQRRWLPALAGWIRGKTLWIDQKRGKSCAGRWTSFAHDSAGISHFSAEVGKAATMAGASNRHHRHHNYNHNRSQATTFSYNQRYYTRRRRRYRRLWVNSGKGERVRYTLATTV